MSRKAKLLHLFVYSQLGIVISLIFIVRSLVVGIYDPINFSLSFTSFIMFIFVVWILSYVIVSFKLAKEFESQVQ